MRPGARTALILARNSLSHDSRILREFETLQRLGFAVQVVGVSSANQDEQPAPLAETHVVRLDPAGTIRRRFAFLSQPKRPCPSRATTPRRDLHAASDVHSSAARQTGGLRRRLRRVGTSATYYAEGISLVRRASPSLVHANDYNTMWIGLAAKALRGSHLVYDSHELWPDRNGRPEWRLWLVACEALFVRVADATITTSPGYAAAMASRYRVAPPIVVRNVPELTGGAQTEGSPPDGRASTVAVYVGGLMPGRGLEQAIDALAQAPGVCLRLIGPGREPYRALLKQRIDAAGMSDRVDVRDAVAPGAVLGAIADADMGLMLIQPICRSYELTLPNKLFEYVAAGLPILASDLPVIGPVVRDEGIGEVVAAADLEQIALAMLRLAEPETNEKVRDRVRSYGERVTWERERPILEQVYAQVGGDPADVTAGKRGRVARAYRGYAASPRKRRTWSSTNPGNGSIRAELVEATFRLASPELSAARGILDVGCGTGWWLESLAADQRSTAVLHGLELLPDRATAGQRRVPNAEVRVGDAGELPFAPGAFDVVTLFTVLSSMESVSDVQRALGEARRVLAPGGVLLVWEPRVPTPNRNTIRISQRLLRRTLDGAEIATVATTVAPPLARHLGSSTARLYPRLAQHGALLTHRLLCARFS